MSEDLKTGIDFLDNIVNSPVNPPLPKVNKNTPITADILQVPSELSAEQKKKIVEVWNAGEDSLKALIQSVFPNEDGRTKNGLAVKKFLASCNVRARAIDEYVSQAGLINLTEDNKEFIRQNAKYMKPIEMARVIFNEQELTPLGAKTRAVRNFYDTLSAELRGKSPEEEMGEYKPPMNEEQALCCVNKYVFERLDVGKLTLQQKEWLSCLVKVMHTYRYIFEVNGLERKEERDLFESSFVRFIYDKPDLTEEEVDLYLNLCSDIIGYQRMQRELQRLADCRDDLMEDDKGKVPMPLIEVIGKLRGDIHASSQRQKTTLNDLNGKRSERLNNMQANNESILKLVEAFRSEESRQRMLKVVEMRQKEVTQEGGRLASMDDLRFELFGAAQSEII